MSNPEEYDVVVLGSGEAGKYLAWAVAAEGKRVEVVECRYVGGSCPNIACLPSNNVIHSAKVASYFRRGVEFGLPAARATSPGRDLDVLETPEQFHFRRRPSAVRGSPPRRHLVTLRRRDLPVEFLIRPFLRFRAGGNDPASAEYAEAGRPVSPSPAGSGDNFGLTGPQDGSE